MKGYRASAHSVPGAFVFLLLGLFALGSLMLILTGVMVYRDTVDASNLHAANRVLRAYVRNAIRSEDVEGCIRVMHEGDTDVLVITPTDTGDAYARYIYVYDGQLRELFTETAYGFDPERGEPICAAESMSVTQTDDLLTLTFTDAAGSTIVSGAAVLTGLNG